MSLVIGEELKQRLYYNTNSKVDEKAKNCKWFLFIVKRTLCAVDLEIFLHIVGRKMNGPFWYSRQCSEISYHYCSITASIMANLKWFVSYQTF